MFHRIGGCGRRYWGKRGAGIVYTDGRHILLLKRAVGDHCGTWCLPGGKAEKGESSLDAAIREAKEECGYHCGSRFDKVSFIDGGHHWTTYFYKIKKPFCCRLSKEHKEYRWVPVIEKLTLKLHPQLKKEWKTYLNRIRSEFGECMSFKEWLND